MINLEKNNFFENDGIINFEKNKVNFEKQIKNFKLTK
jgi:hypothetical protein